MGTPGGIANPRPIATAEVVVNNWRIDNGVEVADGCVIEIGAVTGNCAVGIQSDNLFISCRAGWEQVFSGCFVGVGGENKQTCSHEFQANWMGCSHVRIPPLEESMRHSGSKRKFSSVTMGSNTIVANERCQA